MDNNKYVLTDMNSEELNNVEGGLIMFHVAFIEALNGMYTDFKKGLDDGWNIK